MNTKTLILTLSLTFAVGAAVAAFSRGAAEPASPAAGAECGDGVGQSALPTVVITGHRDVAESAVPEIPRVVVTGRRQDAAQALGASRP